jgi:hypothetical protein
MPDPTTRDTIRLRPWRAVFPDGSTAGMLATSREQATLTARELMPDFVRLEQEGDW